MRSLQFAAAFAMLLGCSLTTTAQQLSERSASIVAEFAEENVPFVAEFVSYRAGREAEVSSGSNRTATSATAPPCYKKPSCGAGSACHKKSCCCRGSRFYGRVDALFLDRDHSSRARSVVEDAFTFQPILTTNDLGADFELGPRLIVGFDDGCGWGLEGSYFGFFDWDDRAIVVGNNDLAIPGDIGLATFDFVDADRMQVDYSSKLHSAELSGTRRLTTTPGLKVVAGFRYLSLDEVFNINSTDQNFGTSDYNVRGDNDLYGGQVGVLSSVCRGNFGWELIGKAGLYGNSTSQSNYLADNDNRFVLRDVSSERTMTAFVSEIGISGYAKLSDRLRMHAGYNLLWIDRVALAADQLDFTDTPTSGALVHTSGEALFHGCHVGLEGRW